MRRLQASQLRWVERTLLAAGIVLGAWTFFVLGQNWYYARMPVPEPAAASAGRRLPGESLETAGTSGVRPELERGTWVARLEAPSVKLRATVLEGSDARTLRRAAGHIEYTPLPGQPGNVGIAGHRDTTFSSLRDVKAGDPLIITTAERVFEYQVRRTWIVEPEDVEVLDATSSPAVTLVTCYPFNFVGDAPQRFIIRAELVAERPRS
jgi:sortase A